MTSSLDWKNFGATDSTWGQIKQEIDGLLSLSEMSYPEDPGLSAKIQELREQAQTLRNDFIRRPHRFTVQKRQSALMNFSRKIQNVWDEGFYGCRMLPVKSSFINRSAALASYYQPEPGEHGLVDEAEREAAGMLWADQVIARDLEAAQVLERLNVAQSAYAPEFDLPEDVDFANFDSAVFMPPKTANLVANRSIPGKRKPGGKYIVAPAVSEEERYVKQLDTFVQTRVIGPTNSSRELEQGGVAITQQVENQGAQASSGAQRVRLNRLDPRGDWDLAKKEAVETAQPLPVISWDEVF